MTKITKEKTIYELNNEEIKEFIENQLPVKLKEKKKYGEVFTSPVLIDKIIELFPKTCWTNPNLKWLDPTAGVGFFMISVYLRLMNGLKGWQPNNKKRSDHIIKNMLYMVELNRTNCHIMESLFGKSSNIICRDFLDPSLYSDTTFDCIIGNPPFQEDVSIKGSGGKSKLYERIFLKAYKILKPNGYISLITPDNIFSGNGVESYRIMIQNRVSFISFNSEIQDLFPGIQQYMCYFLLQKKVGENKTVIENTYGTRFQIILEDRPMNPVRDWTSKTEQMIKKYISNTKNTAIYNRGKPFALYKGNKYSLIYTKTKKLTCNNIEYAVGLGIKKAVIFAISTDLDFVMDYNGKYGVGPNTFYIPFDTITEGKRLEHFLNSSDYRQLALATKTTRQYLKIAFIQHLNLTKIMGSIPKNTQRRSNKKRINKTMKNR
jgi:hypothetical protein